MGRKPNQLVHEFFTRGRKLEDASNRYEHTCKRCGEVFPKGRVDALLTHLLKRCPNTTQADRDSIIFHLQTNPPPKPSIKGSKSIKKSVSNQPEQQKVTHAQEAQLQADTASTTFQQPSALETLAEVSRQHLDFSTRRAQIDGPPTSQDQNTRDHDRILAEQALLFGFQQAANAGNNSALPATQDTSFYGNSAEASSTDLFASELPPPSPQRLVPVNYEPIYQHEQPQIAQAQPPYIFGHVIDPELGTAVAQMPATNVSHSPDAARQPMPEDVMQWNPTNSSGRQAQTRDSLAALSEQPGRGFGLLQSGSRRPVRARFSDDRRKEVQELRKQGACIRCRMLKKPCSDGTPCNTCANVTSARLWKGKCIRKRLAEEFTLYSTKLFHARAKSKLPDAADDLHQTVLPGRMEARLFPDNHSCFCFNLRRYSPSGPFDDARSPVHQIESPQVDSFWSLDEVERISSKIEEYLHQNVEASLVHEPCQFMRATVRIALDLEHEEQTEQLRPADNDKAPRSCYNLQQAKLLQNVVTLWVATGFLIDGDNLPLQLKYDASKGSHGDVVLTTWPSDELLDHASPSYDYIKAQLLDGMEFSCSQLAKSVINELERRLLQRQQVSRFSTFIAAVVLLNCVERMGSLYRALDDLPSRNDTNGAQIPDSAHICSDNTHSHDWPLNVQPGEVWPQAEHLAQLLTMLLRMRALPPATRASDNGKLVVVQEYGTLQTEAGGMALKIQQMAEQARVAAQWLDPLEVDVTDLKTRRDAREDRARGIGGREIWHMAFIALALLPETSACDERPC